MSRFAYLCLVFVIVLSLGIAPGFAQSEVYIEKDDENCATMVGGGNCLFPHCWEVDINYDVNSVQLTSVDLHDPDDPRPPGRVWQTFGGGEINEDVRNAAEQSMRNSLRDQHFNQPCIEPDCLCDMPQAAPNWGPWRPSTVTTGFDIAAPFGGGRLYYTAHGTVNVRGRAKIGVCKKDPDFQM